MLFNAVPSHSSLASVSRTWQLLKMYWVCHRRFRIGQMSCQLGREQPSTSLQHPAVQQGRLPRTPRAGSSGCTSLRLQCNAELPGPRCSSPSTLRPCGILTSHSYDLIKQSLKGEGQVAIPGHMKVQKRVPFWWHPRLNRLSFLYSPPNHFS